MVFVRHNCGTARHFTIGERLNIVNPPRYEHLRRNFSLFLLDYIIFSSAFAMIGASTVVPDFVKRLTTDPHIIGFSGSLFNFFWLVPQLLMAQQINRLAKRSIILHWFAVPLRLYFIILAALLLVTSDATIILVGFLIAYALFAMGDGFITIAWADLLGSTLPKRARSMLYMVAQFSVAIAVLGSRELVRRLLAPDGPPFPRNFAYLFATAGVIFVVAGICLANIMDETILVTRQTGPTLRQLLPFLGTLLRTDKAFRDFARTRVLFDLATMATPFYILFGENVLKLNSASAVGDSILAITMGTAIGSLVFGWLSHRSGSRAVIRAAGCAIVLHPLLALSSAFVGVAALYAVFLVLGFVGASTIPGYFDWIITQAPEDRRPIYLGLTNTISAISNLAPLLGGTILGGLLSVLDATSSYSALFICASAMASLGLVSSLTLIEPRNQPKVEIGSVQRAEVAYNGNPPG